MSADLIVIKLPGEPQGKARPRFRVITPRGGKSFASVYTPKETRDYEGDLKQAGALVMRHRAPLAGPLAVTVTAVMPVPESWSRKKQAAALAGSVRPTVTPDWDNIAKMLDALNKIVWLDDKQIVQGTCIKRYGLEPYLQVDVSEIKGEGMLL